MKIDLTTNDAQESFFSDLYAEMSRVSPINCREVLFEDKVCIVIQPEFLGKGLFLCSIRSLDRGKGHAGRALKWVCALADKHNLDIRTTVSPFGEQRPRFNVHQLMWWYKRCGFEREGRTRHMVRKPKSR